MIEKWVAAIALVATALPALAAPSSDDPELGGRLEALVDGRPVAFPALTTEIAAEIQGDLATVTLRQTFENPTGRPLDTTYLFPLNRNAAVYAMRMEVGDEIIEAVIREKEEARRTFETAKAEGKAAALLSQHRPNMFTQEIANLMPGLPVTVTISYVQTVPQIDSAHQLTVPLVVGPRYQPDPEAQVALLDMGDQDEEARQPVPAPRPSGAWEIDALPDYPPVAGLDVPATLAEGRVSIHARLASGVPVQAIWSDSHPIERSTADEAIEIALATGKVVDNRDFVLRWELGGTETSAGLLAHRDERGGFFSLLIAPPERPEARDIARRELVFVLDTSGSMGGLPIEASKTFMQAALATLRADDHFRILRFSSNSSEFASRPVRATPGNIALARRFVAGLDAGGGTEMDMAIRRAFEAPQTPDTLRLVVFLTDGYIGNEADVLASIRERIGEARIYALGVGSSVNRYLLDGMAREGRGQVRYIDPTDDPNEVAAALADRIGTPVLTDIRIDWGDLAVADVTPARIPDLFAGDTIRVQGRFETPGTHRIAIEGKVNGRTARLPLDIALPEASGTESDAIPLVWARSQIADAMRAFTGLRPGSPGQDALKDRVTELGLTHALATRWTSFVAVSERVVNAAPQANVEANVPLPMPAGVPASAYPGKSAPLRGHLTPLRRAAAAPVRTASLGPEVARNAPAPAMVSTFAGHSTPEPETLAGLVLLALAWIAGLLRRRAARRRLLVQ